MDYVARKQAAPQGVYMGLVMLTMRHDATFDELPPLECVTRAVRSAASSDWPRVRRLLEGLRMTWDGREREWKARG